MRANANLTLRGAACTLVPYRAEHVPVYHEWMQDPAMLEATASEPLSIEEEYEMQKDWARDEKKCTFIVLDPSTPETPNTGDRGLGGMAGDVNLFWNDHEDDTGTAEIEVMVANKGSRRKGVAREALRMMMGYAVVELGVRRFRAKIGFDNAPSLALFSGLGYTEVSRSDVFREATLELRVEEEEEEGGGGPVNGAVSRAAIDDAWSRVVMGTWD